MLHALHGHPIRALVSIPLRLGAPIGGLLLGALLAGATAPDGAYGTGLAGAALGGFLGYVGAVITDDLVLAWDDAPVSKGALLSPSCTIGPSFALAHDRVHGDRSVFGVAGTF
jgi:hypothetical protein